MLHTLEGLTSKTSSWRDAQFATAGLAFIKVAARVTELINRIKVSLPSSYTYKQSFSRFAERALVLPS